MRKLTCYKFIMICIIITLAASGCGLRQAADNGKPIEPPGPENVGTQSLQGHFTVKNTEVGIMGLSVTDDGDLAMVGTEEGRLYLLERPNKLRWETSLTSEPLQASIAPAGEFLAVGTANGEFLLLETDQTERSKHVFEGPVGIISIALDGTLILAGIQTEQDDQKDRVVVVDKAGRILWELESEKLLDAEIAGPDNKIYVNWVENEEPVLGVFSAEGERLWEIRHRRQIALDSKAKTLVSVSGYEIFCYNAKGEELWKFNAQGPVSQVILSEDGSYLAALITDQATQNEDLVYLTSQGEKLWSKRLPAASDVIISADGKNVIVSSWRQYRDDATQLFVYNEKGEEVNVLEVAGRAQKMALANRTSTLVLGLEDGSIFFLNAFDEEMNSEDIEERSLYDYYKPVDFGRDEGESRLTLFFYDEAAQNLIPVTRRVKRTQAPLGASIEELIRGPVQGSYLNRTIPKDEEVGVAHDDGVVTVDLPATLDQMSGSTFLTGVLDSLLMTVSQFPTVSQIQFTVAGEESETFGQEGLMIGETFASQRFGRREGHRLVFIPTRSGEKYYLRAQTSQFKALKDKALIDTLTRHVLHESQLLFPQNVELQEVRIVNNTVQLDFSDSFNRIITESAEAAARAAMLRDALALTIAENAYYAQIEILVNGTPPRTPEGYLPWSMNVIKPYYVNLED
ncbi:MAG: GerMN domain-containing protein [Bacillota bacterium]|nr:GerMN domain-containing protein [Bacillota bacterium]